MSRVGYGFFTAALLDLVVGGVVFAFPYAALSLHAGALGTVSNAIFSIAYVGVCLFSSRLAVRNRRTMLVLGNLFFCVGLLLLFFVRTKSMLFIAPIVMASGSALFYPFLQSWFTEGLDNRDVVQVMGGYSIAWVVGYLLGPFLAGLILPNPPCADDALFKSLDAIFLGAAIIVGFMAVSFIPDFYMISKPRRMAPNSASFKNIPPEKVKSYLKLMWIANFISFFLTGMVRFIFTELAKVERIAPFTAGNVNVVMFLAVIGVSLCMRSFPFWLFKFKYLIIIQLLAFPALSFFAFQSSIPLYFAGSILFGIISAFTFVCSSSYSLMIEGKQDKYININEALIGLGGFLAGILGYVFAETISVKAAFLPGLGIVALIMTIEWVYYKKSICFARTSR
ncbi:MAG: MFS transporter [Chitinivibrionales bacterium]|nr:MFS transporter [Chitinivibrionales bacterium]